MVVVQAEEFGQDGVAAGDEMALYDFRDLLEICNYLGILCGVRKGDTHESTDVEAQGLGFHQKAGAGDDAVCLQPFDPLMNGCTGNTALTCNLQKRHAGVFNQEGKNLLVYFVYVIIA